jgi:hypothetical protein
VTQCIDNWMTQIRSCADRNWPGNAPHRWSQYGLLLNKNSRQDQPPDNWGTRYEANKYKWIWLENDARVSCPGVPSVQDFCSSAASSPGQQPPQGPSEPPGSEPPQVVPGSVAHSRFFAMDNSGSMRGTKIEEARAAALNTVSTLPQGTEMALQFFGTSGCNVETVLDFTTDRARMSEAIKTAEARGDTPLAKAIEEAGAYVRANASSGDRAIILLTDGGETCGGDPVAAAKAINLAAPSASSGTSATALARGSRLPGLMAPALEEKPQAGAPIRLHVIGFDVSPGSSTEAQLQEVAAAGGGRYYPAGSEAQLTQALTQAATQPTVVKGDANGDGRCTEVDALAALRMAVGSDPADLALDVDGDGRVSEPDGLVILQWAAAGGQCGP